MLSQAEIASMVSTATAAMPDTCTIKRREISSDGQGGHTEDWDSHDHTSVCRLRPGASGAVEEEVAAQIAAVSHWTLTVPAGTDILPKDRVLLNGITFEVVVNWGPASWEISRQCLLVLVQR